MDAQQPLDGKTLREIADVKLPRDWAALIQLGTQADITYLLRSVLAKELVRELQAGEFVNKETALLFANNWRYAAPKAKNNKLDRLLHQLSDLSAEELAKLELAARKRRVG